MLTIWNNIKSIFLYIWQLPQNLLGLILVLYYGAIKYKTVDDIQYFTSSNILGNISLGKYIILNRIVKGKVFTEKHEFGHTRQSKILGPLYLIVIGLPSLIWAIFWNPTKQYYSFYTERWANKLGGINDLEY